MPGAGELAQGEQLDLPLPESALVLGRELAEQRGSEAGARAAASSASRHPAGLRLCGMLDEPPRPSTAGSATSPTSGWASSVMSRAIFAASPVRIALSLRAGRIRRGRCAR